MRIAYLILAHHQPQQLGALIERLDDGNARFFVHVDQKSDVLPFRNAVKTERAIFLDERLPIEWGGWNMVQATLDLLRSAHQQSPSTYYQLLSGNCYPIKSNQDIASKLSSGNFNYITLNEEMKRGSRFYNRLIYRQDILKRRRSLAKLNIPRYLGRFITSVRRQQARLGGRTLPVGMRPYKGGQWWCLTHDCARYVLDYAKANPRFVQFFRSTLIPDESFFHTIIANSEFAHTLSPCVARDVTSGNHHVRWQKVGGANKPRVMKERDFDELMASEACFARKFSETKSAQLIKLLHERIGDRGVSNCRSASLA
jgi:Core-2/I-Branching enzyme